MTEPTYTVSLTKGEIEATLVLFDHALRHGGRNVASAAVHLEKKLIDAMQPKPVEPASSDTEP